MNNKHGQVLITFVIMIPLLLLLIATLIELSVISYNKKRLYSLTKTIIASCIENPDKNDIIKLYNKNGIEDDIEVILDDGLEIKFDHQLDSYLGKIVGQDQYEITIDLIGKKENNKIIYTKGQNNE